MSVIRAFIAIELSAEARAVLADVVATLEQRIAPGVVKWVAPQRMHLTLRFLGDTPLAKLEEVAAAMDSVAQQQAPFALELDALGCFPDERRPRVIWVGVRGAVARATDLQRALDEALEGAGWEREKQPFRPHLTLGRVKDRKEKVALPWGAGVAPASIPVHEIVLFESQLRREGPRYIARHRSALRAP